MNPVEWCDRSTCNDVKSGNRIDFVMAASLYELLTEMFDRALDTHTKIFV